MSVVLASMKQADAYVSMQRTYHITGESDIDLGTTTDGPLDFGDDIFSGSFAALGYVASKNSDGSEEQYTTFELTNLGHQMPMEWTLQLREVNQTTFTETTREETVLLTDVVTYEPRCSSNDSQLFIDSQVIKSPA